MSEPRALVEHFFRHEFGRLCAVLTRSLGVRRLALVEDVVQVAVVQALETWSRRGVPEDPAGWLYRPARWAGERVGEQTTDSPHFSFWARWPRGSISLCWLAWPPRGSLSPGRPAWPKTPNRNCRRSKRISPTRS